MKKMRKSIQRKAVALVGVPIADKLGKMEMKNSILVGPKQVFLPKCNIHMNYYEREATAKATATVSEHEQPHNSTNDNTPPTPTLLLLHGIGSSAQEFCSLLRLLDKQIPKTVRILVPEQIGHGQNELERAFAEGVKASDTDDLDDSRCFNYPTAGVLLETTSEFLDAKQIGPASCNAMGTSLGGALLYFLALKRPDIVSKTVLLAPAFPSCLSDKFLGGLVNGDHTFMDFRSREDVKSLFRNFLWTDPDKRKQQQQQQQQDEIKTERTNKHRTNSIKTNQQRRSSSIKKDPFPKVAYEVIYRLTQRNVPEGHLKALQDKLVGNYGKHMLSSSSSIGSSGTDIVANSNGNALGGGNENSNSNKKQNNNHDDEDQDIFATTTDLDTGNLRLVLWPEEDQICSLDKGRQFFGPASIHTTFTTIPDCGHLFHANGTPIYEIVAPLVESFLLDFANNNSSGNSQSIYCTGK